MIVQGYIYSYNTAIKKLKELGLDEMIFKEKGNAISIVGIKRKWWDDLRHTGYVIRDEDYLSNKYYSVDAYGRREMYLIPKCCVKVIERK